MRLSLLLLLILPFGPVAAQEPDDVSRAVARGVSWLRTQQSGGGFGNAGETALALMTLRHSGVPASDRACTRAARNLERALPDGTVYGAALGILALMEQPRADHRKKIERLSRHLVNGQCRNGQWSYAYRATAKKKAGDNSNTQVAILALGVAKARGFAVAPSCFDKLREFLVATQNEDGGWGYAQKQRKRSYGSMTAGGVMALFLCGAEDTDAARRGMRWLAVDFDAARNRNAGRAFGSKKGKRSDATWRHYWLWSLERAMSVAERDRVGGHNWYAEGSKWLLATQRKKGLWRDPERELAATCFSLLFFSRSTRRALTPRPGERVLTPKR